MDFELNGNIKRLIDHLDITPYEFSKRLGDKRADSLYNVINNKVTVSPKMLEKVFRAFPEFKDFVMHGRDNIATSSLRHEHNTVPIPEPSVTRKREKYNDGKLLGDYEPNEDLEPIVTKGGNIHRPVNDEMMLLEIPCVSEKARAGYLSGWEDPEYVETLPTILVPVKKLLKGKYRCFDASGDSMTGGDTRYQIFDGEKVIGREVGHHLWKFKLHYNEFPNWVIHHEDGILIKQIIHHDVEGRRIILHSLNPDKSLYPDFEVSLNDVRELYNVVKRITEY